MDAPLVRSGFIPLRTLQYRTSCRPLVPLHCKFSSRPPRHAEQPPFPPPQSNSQRPTSSGYGLTTDKTGLSRMLTDPKEQSAFQRLDGDAVALTSLFDYGGKRLEEPPYHLHVYAHKHNTHITLTRPDRGPIMSVSTGNLGFKKAGRGTYDAGYQLGAYVMGRIQDQGLLAKITKLELVLRGFGPGRDAVTKVLMGGEGMNLRPSICRVSDATRLKFGGTRSKKPRRLG
ncbi:hypothetical protein MMC24_005422 [Lignoscripta atroalba]|nr:hypothetical protein [Lignoscripta atroalba]